MEMFVLVELVGVWGGVCVGGVIVFIVRSV